jgi:hypothetical protein
VVVITLSAHPLGEWDSRSKCFEIRVIRAIRGSYFGTWQPVEIRAGHLFFSFFISFSFRVSREEDEEGEGEEGENFGRERVFNSLLG